MEDFSLKQKAKDIRKTILEMIYNSKSAHIGSCFSIVELLTFLYFQELKIDSSNPKDKNRDIFVLSKGHAAAALYSVLAHKNFFDKSLLASYSKNGSNLAGHVTKDCLPGVEVSSGSLGHGISLVAGMALKNKNNDRRFFCLVGDGECNEGSIWEAAAFCSHFKLKNVFVIVDMNGFQGLGETGGVINMVSMKDKWQAFGWDVHEVDGHSFNELGGVFKMINNKNLSKPSVILANTIKGKGMGYMEGTNFWHYKSPSDDQFNKILLELT